ncbi:MAG: glycosyltransferase family 2 protein [Candidatus Diapherotrites archaeon]
MDLSVGIPMFNEEGNVFKIEKELFPVLRKLSLKSELIVVDDGSKDKTAFLVSKLQKKFPSVKLVKHKRNLGLGAAINSIIQNSKGKYIIMLDGDFTYKPEEMPKLLEFKNFDIVNGSPYLEKNSMQDVSFIRKLLSVGINSIYAFLIGKKLSCFTGIFRCYNAEKLKKIKIESSDFISLTEILLKMLKKNASIKEIPVTLHQREFGETKINTVKEIKNHLRIIFSLLLGRFK